LGPRARVPRSQRRRQRRSQRRRESWPRRTPAWRCFSRGFWPRAHSSARCPCNDRCDGMRAPLPGSCAGASAGRDARVEAVSTVFLSPLPVRNGRRRRPVPALAGAPGLGFPVRRCAPCRFVRGVRPRRGDGWRAFTRVAPTPALEASAGRRVRRAVRTRLPAPFAEPFTWSEAGAGACARAGAGSRRTLPPTPVPAPAQAGSRASARANAFCCAPIRRPNRLLALRRSA